MIARAEACNNDQMLIYVVNRHSRLSSRQHDKFLKRQICKIDKHHRFSIMRKKKQSKDSKEITKGNKMNNGITRDDQMSENMS